MNFIQVSVTLQSPYLAIGITLHSSITGGTPPAPVYDAETANHTLITT